MSSVDQSAEPTPEGASLPVSKIERLLCTARDGALDQLLLAAPDAWQMQLSDLASFADWPDEAPRAKICIATEQIAGPVRNGGIGNTYASLALMLAEAGFDVTVLYLRGSTVETRTIEDWVADYARKRVKLVPVPNYATHERLQTGADGWLHAPYNMMRWLIEHPMDVVHVSEWRGSAYLCLLAKRQGLAFAKTLFLVKTSSPWMWNRLYGGHFVEKLDDLAKIQAERRTVELADVVIGGSLHLLRWMASQGYALPRTRTFVQPNVATFGRLQPLMAKRHLAGGTRVPIDEFVFFGRLELRKGLFVFCQAIRRLIRKGQPLPPKITFMGKPGGRMPSHPDLEAPDYLRMISADWPTQVEILTDFQQLEAVQYLLSGARLAVMPSIIENSSMAIYEAAICGIPCVASDVGGNSELIVADDHAEVLCEAHPVALGDKLEEALAKGGYVPRPSFDNDQNLEIWQRFHRQLGGPLHEALLAQARPAAPAKGPPATTSVCIYCAGDQLALAATLASLAAQTSRPQEVFLGIDSESSDYADVAKALADLHGIVVRVIEAYDLDAGAGFDLMARNASGEFLHFLWEGATLLPEAVGTLEQVARASGAQLLTYWHRVHNAGVIGKDVLRGLVLGSLSDQFYRNDIRELPLFIERAVYLQLGGYSTDYRVMAHDHELIMRAMAAGLRCETVVCELGAIVNRSSDWMRKAGYDIAGSNFRAIRPLLSAAPLALRDGLLCARGTVTRKAGVINVRPGTPSAAAPFPATARGAPANRPGVAAPSNPNLRPAPDTSVPRLSDKMARMLADRRVRQRGDLVGQFLGIYQGRLYGWACDVTAPGRTLDIALTVEGKTNIIAAKQRFSKWADVPPEAMGNSFTLELPSQYRRNQDGIHLLLIVADSGLVLADGVAVPPGIELDRCGVVGTCESNKSGMLTGWASFPEEPDRVVELAAYIGTTFLARFNANLPHPDAPHGKGGFQFQLPDALLAEGKMQIDVVMAETSIPLPQSPVKVDGQRVSSSQKRLWGWGK